MTVYSRTKNKSASLSRICLMCHHSLIKIYCKREDQVNFPTKVLPFLCAIKIICLCFELLVHKEIVTNHSPELNRWLKSMSQINLLYS